MAQTFREAGLATWTSLERRPLKAQLRMADRTGASYALIVGEREVAAGTVTVRLSRALYPPGVFGMHDDKQVLGGTCEPNPAPPRGDAQEGQWHPDPGTVNPPVVPALGGIGRKP